MQEKEIIQTRGSSPGWGRNVNSKGGPWFWVFIVVLGGFGGGGPGGEQWRATPTIDPSLGINVEAKGRPWKGKNSNKKKQRKKAEPKKDEHHRSKSNKDHFALVTQKGTSRPGGWGTKCCILPKNSLVTYKQSPKGERGAQQAKQKEASALEKKRSPAQRQRLQDKLASDFLCEDNQTGIGREKREKQRARLGRGTGEKKEGTQEKKGGVSLLNACVRKGGGATQAGEKKGKPWRICGGGEKTWPFGLKVS